MQLPRVTSRVPVSPGAEAAPYEALAGVGEVLSQWAQKQMELRQTRELIAADAGGSLAADELFRLEMFGGDYQTFEQRLTKGLSKIGKTYGDRIKDRAAKVQFEENWARTVESKIIKARDVTRQRDISAFVDASEEGLEAIEHQYRDASDDEKMQQAGKAAGIFAGMEAMGLDADKVGERRREHARRLDLIEIEGDIDADAPAAHEALLSGAYPHLDEVTDRPRLIDAAEARINSTVQVGEHGERIGMAEFRWQRSMAVTTRLGLARDGTYTLSDLARDMAPNGPLWGIEEGQYEALRGRIEGGVTGPSDRAVHDAVWVDVRSIDPKETHASLAAKYRRKDLNLDDYEAADAQLTRMESMIAGRSSAGGAGGLAALHAQGEQLIRLELGPQGMMDILSPERKAALIDAMERYSQGSAYMVEGGQDPIPFALKLTEDRRQFVEGAEQSRRDVRRRLLPTREELIAAKATMDPDQWAAWVEERDALDRANGVSAVSDTTGRSGASPTVPANPPPSELLKVIARNRPKEKR